MKVVFVLGSLNIGGAEKVLVNYINHFSKYYSDKLRVDLLLISYEGPLLNQLDKSINVTYLYKGNASLKGYSNGYVFLYKIYRKLISILFAQIPSLYNLFFGRFTKYPYSFILVQDLVFFARTGLGERKILWIQNNLLKISNSSRYGYDSLTGNIDKVVAISQGIYDDLIGRLMIEKNRILFIHNPIDLDGVKKNAAEEVPACWGFDFSKPYIVTMGRLVKQKGFDILIKAFSMLRRRGINSNLVIIGGGEEEKMLRELIHNVGLIDNQDVLITGLLANPYPIIGRSQLFVCSSRFDGLSTSIIEAMALGKPIVSTPCDFGPKEILDNGKYGIIASDINEDALESAILGILTDTEKFHRYSDVARERSMDFSSERACRKIWDTINN